MAPIVAGAEVVRFYATTADGGDIPDDVVGELKPALEPVDVDAKDSTSRTWVSTKAIAAVAQTAFPPE